MERREREREREHDAEKGETRARRRAMARLVSAVDSHLSVSTLADSLRYVPPEYYQRFRCLTKGDV
ncbi:hypothetical protein Taro_015191 [Colocasia esculenta]|uniref:Uncharacterized protein n=1 Tax=Colocasia esculenta TaxID=4460 RepID=A0A843UH35_COLES|nr:hypothetical protein [Colocasia esculenta]